MEKRFPESHTTLAQGDAAPSDARGGRAVRSTLRMCPVGPEGAATALLGGATPSLDSTPEGAAEPAERQVKLLLEGESMGRFRIVRRLGVGGTGAVYEAIDSEVGTALAVKVLHRVGAAQLAAFKSEFRVASRLGHRNLLPPHELFTDGRHWFLSMELVEGGELLGHVRPAPSWVLDEQRLRAVLPQVLDGLEALHGAGIVHRDLKPANVLVAHDGTARIADFGLALLRQGRYAWLDEGGRVVGSPAYMAPEQAAGRGLVGTAADLYGVGMILYEALTQRLPFEGTVYSMLMQKVSCDAPDPRAFAPGAPADLADLTRSLLARDAADRPTLAEARDHLERTRSTPSNAPSSKKAPLVGRGEELLRIEAALLRSRDRAVVMMVQGHSGVGKTALLRAACSELSSRHEAVVLSGACHELESIPYKGIDAVVDELRRYLLSLPAKEREALLTRDFLAASAMFPTLRDIPLPPFWPGAEEERGERHSERQRAYRGLAETLRRIGKGRALVIVLDDMQWCDADGTYLLLKLISQPEPIPALFVLARRSDDHTRDPFSLVSQVRVEMEHVSLDRLPLAAAVELAHACLGGHDRERAERIAREADGEPFLIEQLALHAGDAKLFETIAERTSQLGTDALKLLQVAAVAAQPIPERLLAECLGLSDARFLVGRLIALSLLRRSGTSLPALLYPYHDRIRTAVVDALDEASRAALHRTLAQAAEPSSWLPESALAEHFERGGLPERAAGHAILAAQAAEGSFAFDLAAATFARAALLAGTSAVMRHTARVGRARALHRAGRCEEAGAAYLEAAEGAWPEERRVLESSAVEAWLSCGRVERALTVLKPLLAAADTSYPKGMVAVLSALGVSIARVKLTLRERPKLRHPVAEDEGARADLLWSAGKGLLPIKPPEAAVLTFRSVFHSLLAGDAHRIGRSLAFLGSGFIPLLGREGARFLGWAKELARESGDQHLSLMVGVAEASQGLLSGAWSDAVLSARRVLSQAPHCLAATAWEEAFAHTLLVSAYEYQGELFEMERACLACLGAAEERGDQITAVTVVSAHGYVCAARHDDAALDARIAEMTAAMRDWTVGYGVWDFYKLRLQVLRALTWGDVSGATRLLEDSWPKLEHHQLLRMPIVRGPALILRLAVLIERLRTTPEHSDTLARDIHKLTRVLSREPRKDAHVHAQVGLAALHHQRGDGAARDLLLAEAERSARQADLRIVARMIARLAARLRGREAERASLERELMQLGVADARAWSAFVTPGFECPT